MVSKADMERIEKLKFMNGLPLSIENVLTYVQRSGYTGEDGFEVTFLFSFCLESDT
jgi:glycine cleavage system aminomethyltransferase T